jgi:hypothetical protein
MNQLTQQLLIAAFALIGGAVLGNWLSLGRDRRQERNAAAVRVRTPLLAKQRDLRPDGPLPSADDIDTLEQLLPWWERKRFIVSWESLKLYESEARYQDSYGQAHYHQTDRLTDELAVMLRFTRLH